RDAETNLAPPELEEVHPLGKSPMITDQDTVIIESGAIIDYLIRHYGKGRLSPAPSTPEHEAYLQWLHYAEGSVMLPLMLRMYTSRLGDGGDALQPRIQSELERHLGYLDHALADREWLVGDTLSGADIPLRRSPVKPLRLKKLCSTPKQHCSGIETPWASTTLNIQSTLSHSPPRQRSRSLMVFIRTGSFPSKPGSVAVIHCGQVSDLA
ncbi:MAG TPA: hypothetical protein DEO43_00025, partial [Halieaceae bacterium]|nr:hypothetical protein [Halieaceae bacterium]